MINVNNYDILKSCTFTRLSLESQTPIGDIHKYILPEKRNKEIFYVDPQYDNTVDSFTNKYPLSGPRNKSYSIYQSVQNLVKDNIQTLIIVVRE
jgi:hypothetical protein